MQIVVEYQKFLDMIKKAKSTTSKKSTIEILSNIKLFVEDNDNIYIGATNTEQIFKGSIAAHVDKQGSVTLPADLLVDVISSVKIGKTEGIRIVVDDENNYVKITAKDSNNWSFTLRGTSAAHFPLLNFTDSDSSNTLSFEISQKELLSGIEKVLPCVATDMVNLLPLTGVCAEISNTALRFISTDRLKMCIYDDFSEEIFNKVKVPEYFTKENNLPTIIPSSLLEDVAKILDAESEEMVQVSINDRIIHFEFLDPDIQLAAPLIGAPYLNYRQAMQSSFEYEFKLDRKEFISHLDALSALLTKENPRVDLIFNLKNNDNTCTIQTHQALYGDGKAIMSFELLKRLDNIKNLNVAFSYKKLLDLIKKIDGESLIFKLNGETKSSYLGSSENEKYCYYLAPMRKDEMPQTESTSKKKQVKEVDEIEEEEFDEDEG